MNTSRSLVALGWACKDTACLPTIRYLTLWALKDDKRSLKSGYSDRLAFHRINVKRQLRNGVHAFPDRPASPVPVFVSLHFLVARINANRLFHGLVCL